MAQVKTNAIAMQNESDELDIWIVDERTGKLRYVIQVRIDSNGHVSINHDCPEIQTRKLLNIPV